MERGRTVTSRQAPVKRVTSPGDNSGTGQKAGSEGASGTPTSGKTTKRLYDLNVGQDEALPVDNPLVAGWGPMGEKDCGIKTNRQAGDICGYEFCGGQNAHLSADEKATVSALMGYLARKKNIDPSKCKNDDVINVLLELEDLDLKKTNIRELSPLFMLQKLEQLDLSENQIDRLSYLSGMKVLKSLNVGKNNLTSFNGLQRLYTLEEILAPNNQISSVGELAKLEKLKILDISNNVVSSIVLLTDRSINIKYAGNPDILTEADSIKEDGEELSPNCYKKTTAKGPVTGRDVFDAAEGGAERSGEYATCFSKDGEMTVQKISETSSGN